MECGKIQRLFRVEIVSLTLVVLAGGCDQVGLGDEDDDAESVAVALAWDPPSANADGTEITDLAGFRIYRGTSPGAYTTMTEVPEVPELTVESLSPGVTYYFSVTAYDQEFNESGFSEELAITVSDSGSVVVQ